MNVKTIKSNVATQFITRHCQLQHEGKIMKGEIIDAWLTMTTQSEEIIATDVTLRIQLSDHKVITRTQNDVEIIG